MIDLKKKLNEISCPKAQWIGLRLVSDYTRSCVVEDARPLENRASYNHGVMVEVFKDGRFAYSATTDMDALQSCAEEALSLTEKNESYKIYDFDPAQCRPREVGTYKGAGTGKSFSTKEVNDFLIRACQTMKVSPKIVRTIASAHLTESRHHLVSTSGTDIEQSFSYFSSSQYATAMDKGQVQTRSKGGHGTGVLQGGWDLLMEDHKLWDKLNLVGEEALELLSAPECPNKTMDVLLMPDQMLLQIHESIGHPLEIDRILGDERNYAGHSFVKLEDFGHLLYGSPMLNIVFDPTIPQQYASYAYDDNGHLATKEYLIKEGILLRGLGGLESQSRSGVLGVANERASSWNRPPIDRMANINLESGTSTLKEMISSVEEGILMNTNCSWSIDDYRRKFQFGCEYGKMIKNGELTHTVKNPNYRGITLPFWNNLKMVGTPDTVEMYGHTYCGKGEPNQAIRVGHSSPACLFEEIEVFGGAS